MLHAGLGRGLLCQKREISPNLHLFYDHKYHQWTKAESYSSQRVINWQSINSHKICEVLLWMQLRFAKEWRTLLTETVEWLRIFPYPCSEKRDQFVLLVLDAAQTITPSRILSSISQWEYETACLVLRIFFSPPCSWSLQ